MHMPCKKALDRMRDKNPYQPARPRTLIRAFIVRLQTYFNREFAWNAKLCFLEKKKRNKKQNKKHEIFYPFIVRE